jgi:hypothetical protein
MGWESNWVISVHGPEISEVYAYQRDIDTEPHQAHIQCNVVVQTVTDTAHGTQDTAKILACILGPHAGMKFMRNKDSFVSQAANIPPQALPEPTHIEQRPHVSPAPVIQNKLLDLSHPTPIHVDEPFQRQFIEESPIHVDEPVQGPSIEETPTPLTNGNTRHRLLPLI